MKVETKNLSEVNPAPYNPRTISDKAMSGLRASVKSGIYIIRNMANGKIYIGSAVNVNARWGHHRCYLKQGNHQNKHLQNAWYKYGPEQFEFKKLISCSTDELVQYEQAMIDLFKTRYGWEMLYNNAPRAGSNIGVKQTKEHRAQMSEIIKRAKATPEFQAKKAAIYNAEFRVKQSIAGKGRRLSPEVRSRFSLSHKGKKHAPEHIANNVASRKRNGKKWSEEQRLKASISHKGKTITAQHKARLKSLWADPEFRAKCSIKFTDEVRAKQSHARKQYYARMRAEKAKANIMINY